ncbi:putative phosphoglycerate mutase [Streptomyces griseochromogenes]|uniref:Bifunctional RNase H/acid phosphatase n=1 Tax=Streptomyces griseochromogenes TaxID=68214 RepID=A0A1B1B7J8_9ACTN|nr:bifunctional RNase H/acid phosphatase [Streptomyces griseochromogenes]ANP54712.1 bifunctional RNase H/acid phosphatase [Streptomyces griseochromogenes]MBP2048730.1 putative phosphoglycerate mutase [Streptomyces griseochromogenes]
MREFIVEADGGSRGNPGPAGYGAVVIDAATGETLAEAAEYIGVATNNVAEYRGLLAGLRAAHALDPTARIHVRMDSKLVIEQMSGRWKIKHPAMKPLAAEAGRVLPAEQITYEWIPREQNKHADRLANEAMDAGARGEQWSPSQSRAALDTPRAAPEPSGPPGDAAAGAAKARAALASAGAGADAAAGSRPSPSASRAWGDPQAARVDAAAPPGEQRPGWSAAPDLGAPATFVLLRHGETPLTPQKRFSGSGGTDPSLSDAGREQARRVAEALARRGTIQAVVASPLARTQETAGFVATRLGLDVTIDDGLRETDFGAWEGLTFGEVRERHPDDLNAWLADPEAHPTGGGESFAETATRMEATRQKLVAAYAGRTVLLVTHVTPIKTLVRLALGAPPESLFRMELSAASLSAVAYYADGNASVRLFNDTSHLRP